MKCRADGWRNILLLHDQLWSVSAWRVDSVMSVERLGPSLHISIGPAIAYDEESV